MKTANPNIAPATVDAIADALQQQGYIIVENFLPQWLANELHQEAKSRSQQQFKPAAIGRHTSEKVAADVRSDSTLWLTGDTASQAHYLDYMSQIKLGLNRRLFMGLFDFECHFSHYAKGSFYKKHLDAFKPDIAAGRSNRVLSTVLYLNSQWQPKDGGELVLYPEQDGPALLTVPPVMNSCLVFLSDSFPHEVLTSQSDRYSIAGWYRVNNSSQLIDPAR
jgi:SM-20-related protein